MAQYIWTIRNTTIGDDWGIGYYTSKANAVASIRTWLADQRVTILTDLHEINLRSRSLATVEIVVHALGSHKHQILEIERHHCNNGAWMVSTMRQGQEDPELEKAKRFAKQAEAAMDDPASPFWKAAERVESDDVVLEQKVAEAFATTIADYLGNDRQRAKLHQVVAATSSRLRSAGTKGVEYSDVKRVILERLMDEECRMAYSDAFPKASRVVDHSELWFRFLATVEEHLPEYAVTNFNLAQIAVRIRKEAGPNGHALWLQFHK